MGPIDGISIVRPYDSTFAQTNKPSFVVFAPMSDSIEINPVGRPLQSRIRPPGSKSITNRALVCAALADGTSTLTGALDSEDTRVMIDALRRLGIEIESQD